LITDTVCGNTTMLSTSVTVLPLPVVNAAKSNDIDCSNPSSQLLGSGAAQYNWSPATDLTIPNSPDPIATPAITTLYTVNGIDLAGCIGHDTVTVKVSSTGKGGYLMPTGFTPNNDGLNDCYGIKYWGAIPELDFSIYNRWGERIFHTKNPSDCWNGIYKGVPQNPGVFVYMIRAKTFCENTVFRKGTFALIR
jgi:gliding motility-associated-like protein